MVPTQDGIIPDVPEGKPSEWEVGRLKLVYCNSHQHQFPHAHGEGELVDIQDWRQTRLSILRVRAGAARLGSNEQN